MLCGENHSGEPIFGGNTGAADAEDEALLAELSALLEGPSLAAPGAAVPTAGQEIS